jgi:uncharacterized OB-fold protein
MMPALLQQCTECQRYQYPQRHLCGHCLGDQLTDLAFCHPGILVAASDLHHSLEARFTQQLPWRIGTVKLDCGPTVLVHIKDLGMRSGSPVSVKNALQSDGSELLQASRHP